MRGQPPVRRRRRIVGGALLLPLAMLIAGCSAPGPNTAAGQTEIAGQRCMVCRLENPGDVGPCYAICMQRIEDEAAGAGEASGHQ
jgi:hypothetical protein